MIEITMPVYWTNVKKRKPSTTHLVGMSFYRNAFRYTQNKMKKDLGNVLVQELKKEAPRPINGMYTVTYTYHYKSEISDLLNVGALTSKILNDVLQEEGYVINDNVKYLKEEHFYVGERNKDNPHMQIQIKEYKGK